MGACLISWSTYFVILNLFTHVYNIAYHFNCFTSTDASHFIYWWTCFTIFDVFDPCLQYNTPIVILLLISQVVEKKNLLLKLDGIVTTAKESQQRYFLAICTNYGNRFSCCALLCKLGALYNREFSRLAMDRLLLRAYEKYMVTPSNLQYVAISHFIGHATD